MMIQILPTKDAHRYLGRQLCLHPDLRCDIEINHRVKIAWMKFHQHSKWLLNRHVSLRQRLKLFRSIISPALIFGLAVFPMSKINLEKIAAVQRRMIRSIVGWIRLENETWEETMRRM